ncbi:MAG: SIR2 family protein, partial [Longimicrobiaceae bacterium]
PAAPAAAVPAPPSEAALPELDAHFDRVVRLVEDGRLNFFLGAAIHYPSVMKADQFYRELARIFDCEALGEERYAVAQYIVDRFGREELYKEIRKLFARTRLAPRATHEMFAAWGRYRTPDGKPVPFPVVITTNYDDVLERRLADAGLPFHLLSYQADGPDRGLFYHLPPEGSLRVIERPRNVQPFSDAFVVVKLNGGFNPHDGIPESYATTRLDYWDLAARIPHVLPAPIQRALSADPILFLGHGLAAQDIESLVRFAHRGYPGPRSWAIVLRDHGTEYWRQCGVEILQHDVNAYVGELWRRLAGNGSTAGVAPDAPAMP